MGLRFPPNLASSVAAKCKSATSCGKARENTLLLCASFSMRSSRGETSLGCVSIVVSNRPECASALHAGLPLPRQLLRSPERRLHSALRLHGAHDRLLGGRQ